MAWLTIGCDTNKRSAARPKCNSSATTTKHSRSRDVHGSGTLRVGRIAWNHSLRDGNKRAAWGCMVMFIDLNGGTWSP